jgi:hypothetical protein
VAGACSCWFLGPCDAPSPVHHQKRCRASHSLLAGVLPRVPWQAPQWLAVSPARKRGSASCSPTAAPWPRRRQHVERRRRSGSSPTCTTRRCEGAQQSTSCAAAERQIVRGGCGAAPGRELCAPCVRENCSGQFTATTCPCACRRCWCSNRTRLPRLMLPLRKCTPCWGEQPPRTCTLR